MVILFFKQKTAYEVRISDWSSDVCSTDRSNADRRVAERHRDLRRAGRGSLMVYQWSHRSCSDSDRRSYLSNLYCQCRTSLKLIWPSNSAATTSSVRLATS